MMKQIFTLATLVALEALRTRFFVIIILCLLIGFGFALFIGQITVIETTAYQSSLLAAFLRLSAVYIVSLFVITSMVREFQDNSVYLWLSLPIPRSTYVIGKFSGFTQSHYSQLFYLVRLYFYLFPIHKSAYGLYPCFVSY
jgi:ABC-type transport system involved in multi-copper enzyme maturation permease subunit